MERKINILEIEKAQLTEKIEREKEITEQWQERYKESAKRVIELTHYESDLEFAKQRETHFHSQLQAVREEKEQLSLSFQQRASELERYQGLEAKIAGLSKEIDLLNQLLTQEKANTESLKENSQADALIRVDLENKVRILIEENEKINEFLTEKMTENEVLKQEQLKTLRLEHEVDKLNEFVIALTQENKEIKSRIIEQEEKLYYLSGRDNEAERYKSMASEMERRVTVVIEENNKLNLIIEEKSNRISNLQSLEGEVASLREQLGEMTRLRERYQILERKMQVIFNETKDTIN